MSYENEKINNRWQTPDFLFSYFDRIYNFDFDAACCSYNKKCDIGIEFDKGQDSLKTEWSSIGKFAWCNPPYGKVKPWIHKAVEEMKNGVSSVLLVNCPSGESYQDLIFTKASKIFYITGRVKFVSPVSGQANKNHMWGTVGIVFDSNKKDNIAPEIILLNRDSMIKDFLLFKLEAISYIPEDFKLCHKTVYEKIFKK